MFFMQCGIEGIIELFGIFRHKKYFSSHFFVKKKKKMVFVQFSLIITIWLSNY